MRASVYWLRPVCVLIVGIGVGLYVGVKISKPKTAMVMEEPAPAIRQQDGSLVLERKPDPVAKPAHAIPKGATIERIVSVSVKPKASELQSLPVLNPVRVDLTFARLSDQTMRVIASSPDGEVIGGNDIPVQLSRIVVQLKNSAGVTYGRDIRGIWYDRYWRRLVVGCEARRTIEGLDRRQAWSASIRLGITF